MLASGMAEKRYAFPPQFQGLEIDPRHDLRRHERIATGHTTEGVPFQFAAFEHHLGGEDGLGATVIGKLDSQVGTGFAERPLIFHVHAHKG